MPLETDAQRAAAIGTFAPWNPLTWPDASMGEDWRMSTLGLFVLGGSPPSNAAPVVQAGADFVVWWPAGGALHGLVTDDGQPGPVTVTWSQVSGGGTVTFGDGNAAVTTATFSAVGTYGLRLTADDGEFSVFDEVTVVVQTLPPSSGGGQFGRGRCRVSLGLGV